MSADWIYDANSPENEIKSDFSSLIEKIYCNKTMFPSHLRIYPWIVQLKSGETFGLYKAEQKGFTFSPADKLALENAMINATALRVGTGIRQIQEVESADKCCYCFPCRIT